LTDFINEKSREGFTNNPGFTRSVAYKLEEMGEADVIVRKEWTEFYVKRNTYNKRHPYYYAAILAAVGVIFSIIAGTVNAWVSDRLKSKEPQKEIQELRQNNKGLSDSLKMILLDLKTVQDSLTKHKHPAIIKK